MTIRPALAGAAAGFVIFACLVTWFALRLIRGNREQVLVISPLIRQQQFTLGEAGDVVVMLETPRMQTDYAGLVITVVDHSSGATTTMPYDYVRAQGAVHGMSTIRVPFGRLHVARPGTYDMHIAGLAASHDYSGSRIVLSRPYLGRMALQIVGIVLCGVGALVCLILGAWQIFPPQRG